MNGILSNGNHWNNKSVSKLGTWREGRIVKNKVKKL